MNKNACLKYPDREDKTSVDYLLNFAEGPCNPVILAHGALASKLIVQINCEEFQENKDLFKHCGWSDCSKNGPDKEYQLWIPKLDSPLSILRTSTTQNKCFASLINHLNYDWNQEIEGNFFVKTKGITIRVYGFTESTKASGQCGAEAIRNLLPFYYQTGATKGFGPLIEALEYLGYRSGLTYQAIPYNFMLSFRNNEFKRNFFPNLKRLFDLTQKKVAMIGHSMGNVNLLYNIGLTSKEDKQKYMKGLYSVTPAFIGGYKPIDMIVANDRDYMFQILNYSLGFTYESQRQTNIYSQSLFEMIGQDPFKMYEKEPFLNEVKQQIKHEQQGTPHPTGFMKFWPSRDDICYRKKHSQFLQNCRIGLHDTKDEVVVRIGKE